MTFGLSDNFFSMTLHSGSSSHLILEDASRQLMFVHYSKLENRGAKASYGF